MLRRVRLSTVASTIAAGTAIESRAALLLIELHPASVPPHKTVMTLLATEPGPRESHPPPLSSPVVVREVMPPADFLSLAGRCQSRRRCRIPCGPANPDLCSFRRSAGVTGKFSVVS